MKDVDLDFLRGLIEAIDASDLDHIDITRGGTRVRISRTPAPTQVMAGPLAAPSVSYAPAPSAADFPAAASAGPSEGGTAEAAPPAPASRFTDVKSPMVGTFYRAPSPDAPAYVEVGTRVAKGQTLCILEAMKLMNELEAEVAGTVREVLLGNGEPVEYGQVLFRIEPDA
ncbi:hypothetical protein BH24GEM2_BH24GEM2_02290 [soil metagenome]|jgi:acetyl-CoA carboxylase biotin carboxyl carrier protein|nr:acetyl-CoA carboxylase biotin carboxyl carrier protein [Gemmatimonadota bacterium]